MDYEVHSKMEKFEEFLKLNYSGINNKYRKDTSVDADELWNCSFFLAKILHHAQPISNISTEEGFNGFVKNYEQNHGCIVNLQELFDSFFLRKIGGQIMIAGQISYSCLTFEEIIPYRKELSFLVELQATDKQNNMDSLKFKKDEFEVIIQQYEQKYHSKLDRKGIYFKKWSSEKEGLVTFSNMEAYFQGFIDCWDSFEFINAYKNAKLAIEERSFLFIANQDLEKIHGEHQSLYPDIPDLEIFKNDSQFKEFDRGFQIRFHDSESKNNYWHMLANQVSGRFWTLLDRDNQRSNKQVALKEWLYKTKHLDAHEPLICTTNSSRMSFCNEAFLFLKNEPDLAGGKNEIVKMIYDSRWKGGFTKVQNYFNYEITETEPIDIYKRLTNGTLDNDNILYDQRSRTGVTKLISAFVCNENKYIPEYDDDGDALPQKPFNRICQLLFLASERPYLIWKICYTILHRRQEILPALYFHPQLSGLGFVLVEKMPSSHPADMLNGEVWKQSTALFISCATNLHFRPKEFAKIIFQLFCELNRDKYQDMRGGRPTIDPVLAAARVRREEDILGLLISINLQIHTKQYLPQVFNYLCFYFRNFKVIDRYKNRLIRFPMVQWDGIFRLIEVIASSRFKSYYLELERHLRTLTGIFLTSYLGLLETDEVIGFDLDSKTDKLGKVSWSESIERLDKLQWIYPIYHLHKYGLLGQFLIPRIHLAPAKDIYDEKNRIHILQLRTHIGVLLQLLKKLVSPEIPYGFEKAKLLEIRTVVENQVITYVKRCSVNDPAVGKFDIFEFNHEESLFGSGNEALLPRLALAINWFSDKDAIIDAIKTSGDYHKLLTMLEWITSAGITSKLLEHAKGADVLAILDKQNWIPEVKSILLQLSHNSELLDKLEEALVYYEVEIADRRKDFDNKMEAFRIRLMIAYFNMDEQMLNKVKEPIPEVNVHTNDLTGNDYRSFYRGLIYLSEKPDGAYGIFNNLYNKFPQYPSLAINRLNAAYKLAEKNADIKGFADALGEWQDASSKFTAIQQEASQPNCSILQLQLFLKLGFDDSFDKMFNELAFPYQMLPDILTLKIEHLTEQGRGAEALYWIEKGEVYHKFDDVSQLQFLEDLKLKVKGLDNIDDLQYQYRRIFDAIPDKLVQVIPARINGKTSMPEFLVQEFVHATDKMLDKIRSIDSIKDENKYNDLLEVILESRIHHYGWSVSGQHRGGFSDKIGPQPGERDLPVFSSDNKILIIAEALIFRGSGTAIPHLNKIFNYYHQRENLLVIYYDLSKKNVFDDHWSNYPTDILSKCQFPDGYELTGTYQDVSADFKVKGSAIKIGKTTHASGSVIYHMFIQVNYNI